MNAPQIIVIVLLALRAGVYALAHGEQRKGTYNGLAAWFGIAMWAALLWWGGFWK